LLIQKEMPELKDVKFTEEIKDCKVCRLAKLTRQPHKKIRYRFHKPLMMIHTDLLSITPIGIIDGGKYIVTFTDDHSRFSLTYTLRSKKQIGLAFENCIKEFRALIGDQDRKVRFLRSDGGHEYLTDEVKLICLEQQLVFETSPPDSAFLNGVAERINRSLLVRMKVYHIDSGLPLELWELALAHAVHVHNKLPHATLDFKTPFKTLCEGPPDRNYLKHFGCIAYMRIPYPKKKQN